jgi:hypothetical protein
VKKLLTFAVLLGIVVSIGCASSTTTGGTKATTTAETKKDAKP